MSASISDNSEKVLFQSDLWENISRIQKGTRVVFKTQQDNGIFKVSFIAQLKAGFVKNKIDLIKNDHMILQKKGSGYFLLFEAAKDAFIREDDEREYYEEAVSCSDYDYKILIKKDRSARPEIKKPAPADGPDAALNRINAMLEEHGITDADPSSAINEFMKTWKLGHPEEN